MIGCAGAACSTCVASDAKTKPAEGSVESTLYQMREAMVNYDNMLCIARQLNDPRALRIITDCKNNWNKRHRRIDPTVKQQLDEDLAQKVVERDAMRDRLRKEESVKAAAKRKRKAAEVARQERSSKRRADREAAHKLRMTIDVTWTEPHFGQGLPDTKKMVNYKKTAKPVISNYREAFNRLRQRCPPLPEHLDTQWEHLQEEFGAAWLEHHRGVYGNRAGKVFIESVAKLFEDTQFHHACAPCSCLHDGPSLQAANCVCGGFPWRCQAWWLTAGGAPANLPASAGPSTMLGTAMGAPQFRCALAMLRCPSWWQPMAQRSHDGNAD